MKILILANSSTGLYIFRINLMHAMMNKNIEVVASTPFGDKVTELTDSGVRLINTPIDRRGMNPVKDLSLLMYYFRLVNKEKPDLVITYSSFQNRA